MGSPLGDEFWVTQEQFEERKLDAISRACVNYVKAGEITIEESFILRDRMMELPMEEIQIMLIESRGLAEEHGIPLVYRLNGVMN